MNSRPVRTWGSGGDIGVTPPFVKNCTLRPEFTRGIGVISGSTGLTLDKSSIRSRLPRRPRYRSSGAVVTSASRLNVQFFTNGGVTPNSTLELSIHNLPSESDLRGQNDASTVQSPRKSNFALPSTLEMVYETLSRCLCPGSYSTSLPPPSPTTLRLSDSRLSCMRN